MLGFIAQALSEEIVVDRTELEDARWFTRREVARAMDGESEALMVPPRLALAHHLIKRWLDAG
ncbi:hypothetical protein JCM17844_23120 [Iodidimonas gelatinilytica]|uniref:NADH pyrophosphatase n=2 Tax=Iodidimonas TaxID=2066486 RepID=A0A5A7MUV4_9PROT|nr:hypothetical protein [Iodidimonas gelatinilytica]GEQ98675.1 hypothetical protein JCM17844_23120 [Iodidimonas gelatinilytica]